MPCSTRGSGPYQGQLCSAGDIWKCLETFLDVTTGWGYEHWVGRARRFRLGGQPAPGALVKVQVRMQRPWDGPGVYGSDPAAVAQPGSSRGVLISRTGVSSCFLSGRTGWTGGDEDWWGGGSEAPLMTSTGLAESLRQSRRTAASGPPGRWL